MPLLVRAAPKEHLPWLIERVGFAPTPALKAVEAVDERTGRILGMVGYDSWTATSVQAHIAVDSSLAWRALLYANGCPAFSYPFEEAGREILLGVIRSDNRKSLAFAKRLGMRETHRVRDGWDRGVDLVMMEIRKPDCKWLRRKRAA